MTYESIKLFKDISQTHSISKAAAMNGISQSAATQQVQELERILGVPLLDRTTRPIALTEAGELYGNFCREMLHRKEELDVALERLKPRVEGTVRVASIYSVGLSELAQLEKDYALRQPQARLEIQYLRPEKVYAAVLADEADLGLVSYPEPSREITVIPWRREEMVLATAPDHPLARKTVAIQSPIPVEDLEGLDFVGFDEELPIRREIDRFLRERGVAVNLVLHFDNLQMVKEAVAHRAGASILPARAMRDDIRQKRLAAVRIAGADLYRPLGIVHRKKKRFHRVAQAFLDLLREKPAPEVGAA